MHKISKKIQPKKEIAGPSQKFLRIHGAREHNLKNINIDLPRDAFIVITGVSGSGKSSLAFDTIYAEGQRRYVESLSAYARQFLGRMEKPKVDLIEGLSPAISIEQKTSHKNPRSTVGTNTEIYDYIRLLFARIGKLHCPHCKRKVKSVTVDQIVAQLMQLPSGSKLQILAPLIQNQKGEFRNIFEKLEREGFRRVRLDGAIHLLEDEIRINKKQKHNLEVIVDRFTLKDDAARREQTSRLSQSVEKALSLGNGNMLIVLPNETGKNQEKKATKDAEEIFFSQTYYCKHCDFYLPELSPQAFSFNSPKGACPECHGLGNIYAFTEKTLVPDPKISLLQGAIAVWSGARLEYNISLIHELANQYDFNPHDPWQALPALARKAILYGSSASTSTAKRKQEAENTYPGLIPILERKARDKYATSDTPSWLHKYLDKIPCSTCKGGRLRVESLAVFLEHQNYKRKQNIVDICALNIGEVLEWFETLTLNKEDFFIAEQLIREISSRLRFLKHVGVEYLSLDRASGSLSGGEAQRIRLATQIGSSLMGVLYVLDEPSIGLHQRDNARLLEALFQMRDLGNTLIVVEHDEETIRKADYIVDIGPGAGKHGGQITASGNLSEILQHPNSLTAQYLSGRKSIPIRPRLREGLQKQIVIRKAKANNLKNIDVAIPLGKLICVTGVSGSGKSTLIHEVLIKRMRSNSKLLTRRHLIDSVIAIDQEPIGRTPRSNPATYTGVFTPIRELFAKVPEAVLRGYQPGRFSFNVSAGRCEKCEGAGQLKIEMHFLPDLYVQCDACAGYRFKKETLEVRYKGNSIYDVLEMTVGEAVDFFQSIPNIYQKLITLKKVGLSYIRLGQAATTLSGGEAQRIKLSKELARQGKGHILYILDEPTTGLHFEDIARLLRVLHELVDRGNTMIIIEHNLDVIKTADHIIDLGPEGGAQGGSIIACGTPLEICKVKKSYTGQYLQPILVKAQQKMNNNSHHTPIPTPTSDLDAIATVATASTVASHSQILETGTD